MDERLVTTLEAAVRLGVSLRRVQALIKGGRLAAVKMGRDWLVREGDLEAFARLPREVGWPKGRPRGKAAGDGEE